MGLILKVIDNHPDNINALFGLIDENRAYLKQFLGWLDYNHCINDTKNHLNTRLKSMQNNQNKDYFIVFDDKIIGMIDVRDIGFDKMLGVYGFVGYWVAKSHSNQGLTTQALQILIEHCKSNQINTLILRANPNNFASNKVAQKCGFIYQRTDKNAENLYGTMNDLNVYYLSLS